KTGGATARDVKALIELVQKKVFEASGYSLQPEVRIW
ncbi:MAG: UDP-N-acetylenolpyruvoylglucosamine reductase, partial [Oscillospiraceae bacterium]